jgi:hypothetical protein
MHRYRRSTGHDARKGTSTRLDTCEYLRVCSLCSQHLPTRHDTVYPMLDELYGCHICMRSGLSITALSDKNKNTFRAQHHVSIVLVHNHLFLSVQCRASLQTLMQNTLKTHHPNLLPRTHPHRCECTSHATYLHPHGRYLTRLGQRSPAQCVGGKHVRSTACLTPASHKYGQPAHRVPAG